jgi:two-component system sensor kinase FixL
VDQFNNIGATGEEVVLMKVWDIPWFRDFPEARQEIRQSVITAAQGKLVRDELEIPGAGDATATIDFSIKPVPGRDNEIPVLLAEGRDISDRIRAENEKQRYQQEFAHNMRINSMGEIAATMAHELNHPLTALISYCGTADAMLSGLTSAPAGIRDILHRATEQAHRAGQIIQQMRRYIRDETPRKEPVEVDRLIGNIERFLGWELKNSDIQLSFGLKCENCVVEVDSIEIEQVMINLVHNGIDAINRTSNAAGSINIQSRLTGNSTVEISIMDSGPGIDASMQDGLFKPCQSDKREGMGLGLTISRSIIEKHGGKLFYDSKTTGQHAFRFTLPLHNQTPAKN